MRLMAELMTISWLGREIVSVPQVRFGVLPESDIRAVALFLNSLLLVNLGGVMAGMFCGISL